MFPYTRMAESGTPESPTAVWSSAMLPLCYPVLGPVLGVLSARRIKYARLCVVMPKNAVPKSDTRVFGMVFHPYRIIRHDHATPCIAQGVNESWLELFTWWVNAV